MKAYEGVEVQLQPFSSSAQDGGEFRLPSLVALFPVKKLRYAAWASWNVLKNVFFYAPITNVETEICIQFYKNYVSFLQKG